MVEKLRIFQKVYDLTQWAMNHTQRFPKSHRFSLGLRIENTLLDILEAIIEANIQRDKIKTLQTIDKKLNSLRILFRLSNSLHFLATNSYEYACKETDEIGKLLGGWIKQQTAQKGDKS